MERGCLFSLLSFLRVVRAGSSSHGVCCMLAPPAKRRELLCPLRERGAGPASRGSFPPLPSQRVSARQPQAATTIKRASFRSSFLSPPTPILELPQSFGMGSG